MSPRSNKRGKGPARVNPGPGLFYCAPFRMGRALLFGVAYHHRGARQGVGGVAVCVRLVRAVVYGRAARDRIALASGAAERYLKRALVHEHELLRALGVRAAVRDRARVKLKVEHLKVPAGSCRGASLELLPYHRYGEAKYAQLGLRAPGSEFGTPSPEQLERWLGMARERGIETVSFK